MSSNSSISKLLLGTRWRRLNALARIGSGGRIRVNRRALIELGSSGGRDCGIRARICSRPSREVRTKSTRYVQMHTRTVHVGFPSFAKHLHRRWKMRRDHCPIVRNMVAIKSHKILTCVIAEWNEPIGMAGCKVSGSIPQGESHKHQCYTHWCGTVGAQQ